MRKFAAAVIVCAAASVVARADVTVYTQWPFDAREAARRQVETAKALNQPTHLTLDLGGVPMEAVLIPAGTFMMGSPDTETIDIPTPGSRRTNESALHEVAITKPFYMSTYKVTQAQYQRVMGSNPSKFVDDGNPVDAVTRKDAALFCEEASALVTRTVSLPTEAQWEYAARGGSAARYFFGDDESKIGDHAWFRDNAKGRTHPVGSKTANAWGLFDVHGLLWEYASDFYADSYAPGSQRDPAGPASGTSHVTRGGTYGSRPGFVRSAIRLEIKDDPAATKDLMSHFGFRVAVALPAPAAR